MNRRFFSALMFESSKNYGFLTVATFSYDFTMTLDFIVENYCVVIYIESTINLLRESLYVFIRLSTSTSFNSGTVDSTKVV